MAKSVLRTEISGQHPENAIKWVKIHRNCSIITDITYTRFLHIGGEIRSFGNIAKRADLYVYGHLKAVLTSALFTSPAVWVGWS
ncbi:hypothetical protein XELAEV_180284561mg, partial [Xenopus laevis]